MTAKYYIYRNLHANCFSIKYRGIVIEHANEIVAHNVKFVVSESRRQKVIADKCKNVHAYIVCDSYDKVIDMRIDGFMKQVVYNPYKSGHFLIDNKPIHDIEYAYLVRGKEVFVDLPE